jgi:predicted ATP-dependent endonuclease of OLD family
MLELVLRSKTSWSKIFCIEEPDSFIHPHGVRRLASLVKRIDEDASAQVILTTHSPSLLATLPPRDIVRVDKTDGHTVVTQSPGTLADPVFARFVNQDSAEMFFARRVVLVEGLTERFLLPPLSGLVVDRGQSLDFDTRQMSLVDLQGKTNVVNFLKILDEFGIEARAVLDNDFLGDTTCGSLVAYLRSKGKTVEDSTSTKLRAALWSAGILVLSKGEIENYVPEADVASVSGRSLSDVQAEFNSEPKRSRSFRRLFGSAKPLYAQQLAEYYLQAGAVPSDIERLIKRLCA